MIEIVYGIDCQLRDAVNLVSEISENTGFTPLYFMYNNNKYNYNITDARKLQNDIITANEYIERNMI